jgi:shikimate kinase
MSPVLVLIGPPGSGKSTVAGLLAERLGVPHTDTDTVVEVQAGKAISDIFVDSGEAHFRTLERAAARDALAGEGVVCLGGGAVRDPDTRADLAGLRVVFLDVGLAEAARRVGLGTSRPLLLGNVRSRLKSLMDARRPVYLEVATVTVDTDGRTPDEIAAQILDKLGD